VEAAIDGEGTVRLGIYRDSAARRDHGKIHRLGHTFVPQVSVTNTSVAFIEKLCALTGLGRVYRETRVTTGGRPIFRWHLRRSDTRRLLRAIELVVKRDQQRLLIEAMELMNHWGKNQYTSTADYRARLHTIYVEMGRLNKRRAIPWTETPPLTISEMH
jgi:hypothetical protein